MAHGNPQCVARTWRQGPQQGQEIWRVPINGKPPTSPVIGPDGTIYVTASDTEFSVLAISPEGQVKWKFHPGRHIESGPLVAADGTIYVGADYNRRGPTALDNSGAFYALNPDGTER